MRRTPSLAAGSRRLFTGLAAGSMVAATLSVLTAPGVAAVTGGGPVVLDGFRAVCWSAEDDFMPGMSNPGPMVNYTKKLVAGVYGGAAQSNDGTIAVLGVSASKYTCGQTFGEVAAGLLGSIPAQLTYYPTAADVATFLGDLADGDVAPAFVWLPDGAADVDSTLATHAEALRSYVTAGGGLLSHQNAYGWLDEFAPGITVSPKAITTNGDENVTAEAATAFGMLENDVPFGSEQAFAGDLGVLVPYIKHVSGLNSTIGGRPTFTPAATAPSAPALSAPVAKDGAVELALAAPVADGGSAVTGYSITATPGDLIKTVTAPGTVLFDGLDNGVEYTFTATATNLAGTSLAGTPVTATPVAPTSPRAPSLTKVVAGNGKLIVSVNRPAYDGGSPVTKYVVVAQPGGRHVSLVGAQGGAAIVNGLTNGVTYTLTATAVTAAGSSPSSAAVTGKPFTVAAKPATPRRVANTLDTVTVSVTAPKNDGGAALSHLAVTVKGAGTTKSFRVSRKGGRVTVTGLVPGTAYRVTVAAVNRAGSSAVATTRVTTKSVPKKPQPVSAVKTKLYPNMTATLTGDGLFRYGSAQLTKAGRAQVVALAKKLTTAKQIRCAGHTDGGNSRANYQLGLARAKQVCSVLVSHGVKAKRTAVSFGAKEKIKTGGSRESRAINRRVEVRVVR